MWVWFLMLGRSPGGDQGNPLQYSCLKNPYEQRSLDRSNLGCGKGRSVFSGQERWLTWFVLLLVLRTIRFMSAEPWCLLLTSIFLEHVNSQTVFFPHIQSSYKKYYWIIDKTKTKPMPFLLLWEGKKKKEISKIVENSSSLNQLSSQLVKSLRKISEISGPYRPAYHTLLKAEKE